MAKKATKQPAAAKATRPRLGVETKSKKEQAATAEGVKILGEKTVAEAVAEVNKEAFDLPIITGGEPPKPLPDGWNLSDWWLVEVIETSNPNSKVPIPINISTRKTEFDRIITTNVKCQLPEGAIKALEEGTVITHVQEIQPSSAMYGNREKAERQNPGRDVVFQGGRMFLVEKVPRYFVKRLARLPAEQVLNPSGGRN